MFVRKIFSAQNFIKRFMHKLNSFRKNFVRSENIFCTKFCFVCKTISFVQKILSARNFLRASRAKLLNFVQKIISFVRELMSFVNKP